MQRSHDDHDRAHAQPTAEAAARAPAEHESPQRFTTSGALPPVMSGGETAELSPSDRAYAPLSAAGRIMDRISDQDGAVIEEASKRYGIPEVDILAVITQESRGEATANAGANQRDHGRHAASGLMQVTEETWKHTQSNHAELASFGFASHRYDRRANILVGTAALKDKREALENLGVPANGPNATALTTMAFNAGEGIVSDAYHRAVHAGSRNPADECLHAQYLKPAIAKYPSVYAYYLTGGGKSKNPQRSVERAIELKFEEISKYPDRVEMLIAEANAHEMTDATLDDMPLQDPTRLASTDRGETNEA